MITIKDYDTGFQMDQSTIRRLKSMSGILVSQLNSVPIFFVKDKTIDRCCDIIQGKCLSRKCTDEIMEAYQRENVQRGFLVREEKVVDMLEKLGKCLVKYKAIGCYVPDGDEICKDPHILICQERINYRNKKQFEDILLEVILHELTHAYFSTEKDLNDISIHIIEESLCEAYAFSKFNNTEELFEFMSDQNRPPEYTSFKFWTEMSRNVPLILTLNRWKSKEYEKFPFTVFPGEMFLWQPLSLKQIAMFVLSFD